MGPTLTRELLRGNGQHNFQYYASRDLAERLESEHMMIPKPELLLNGAE